MRHGKKINHLGRTASHRNAMMSNMASSLITHKRINTTLAKAKSLQRYIEPLITKSKTDDTNNRRMVFKYLQNKESVAELFREVAPKVGDRPGGYTRIIKTGFRQGDSAEMAMIELVDFNELYTSAKPEKKTRRSRRGGSKKAETAEVEVKEEATEEVKAEDPKVEETPAEEPKAETTQETPEATDESSEEKKD